MKESLCFKMSNSDIFEGDGSISYGRDVFVRNGRFDAPFSGAEVVDCCLEFSGLNVIPGAIDCQVNGAGGILFEDVTDESALLRLDRSLASKGTTRWCGTFISTPCEKIERVLKVVEECALPTGLIGMHFEGPWINPNYRGCHPSERIVSSSPAHVDLLDRATRVGMVIVTLAPEVIADCDLARIRRIPAVLICVGHSEATPELIDRKLGADLRGLTHVSNCMPSMSARSPGPFGSMMRSRGCWGSLIGDGEHVCRETFEIIKRSAYREKVFLVSDQMPLDAAIAGAMPFGSETIVFDGNVLRTARGRLAGGVQSIVDCMRIATSRFLVPADEAIRMGTEYPARFLGVAEQYGMIDVGRHADFIIADNQLDIRAVFRNGVRLV